MHALWSALFLASVAACPTGSSTLPAGSGWFQGRMCQYALCDGHCCKDKACWTQYCAKLVCKPPLAPTPVAAGDAIAVDVVAGGHRTCVITDAGAVRCWGAVHECTQPYGYATSTIIERFSDAPFVPDPRIYPSDVPLGVRTTALAIGSNDVCAHGDDHHLRCWGKYGGIVDILADVVSVDLGHGYGCAVTGDGRVMCWGNNDRGKLGLGDREMNHATPGVVDLGRRARTVATGAEHACAILDDHTLRCWGNGLDGALGHGNHNALGDDETPASAGDVPVGEPVVAVAAGGKHTCVLLERGRVRCWGANTHGQLGYGFINTLRDAASVKDVPIDGKATAITAGAYHTCALLDTGAVRCWGACSTGQLGYGTHRPQHPACDNIGDDEPASAGGDVPLGARALSITAGDGHTCARLASGALRCWGAAEHGQLGYVFDPKLSSWQHHVGDDETPAQKGNVPYAPNWEPKKP